MSERPARPPVCADGLAWPGASNGERTCLQAFSAVARPAVAKRPATVSPDLPRRLGRRAGYVVRRSAIATLRELDDRALSDIGIARSQIEAAVHGLIPSAERGRLS